MAAQRIEIDAAGRLLQLEYCWLNEAKAAAATLVFLHEGLGSVAMWRQFPARLCDALGVRGLVYSRFGYGKSTPRPPAEHFTPDYLHREAREVLPQLLDRLGVARPFLFGHSDGGTIALLAAAGLPGRFPGIVVLAPHYFVEEVGIESIRAIRTAYEEHAEHAEHGLRARLAAYHDDVDSAFYGWNDAWLDPAFRHWNIEAELAGISCPVLAIQGEDDEYASLEQVEGLRRRVAQTELLVLPACGHSPHRERPAEVIDGTRNFLLHCGVTLRR